MKTGDKTPKHNKYIDNNCENECFDQIIDIIKTKEFKKIKIPDKIHFIWIGNLYCVDTSYIRAWNDINKDKLFFLWIDTSSSFINEFQKILKKHCSISSNHKDLLNLQNEAFNYIWPKIQKGASFNEVSREFLNKLNIGHVDSGCNYYRSLPHYINILDIQEILTNEYKKIYYYELILRGNLACASDLIRLLILYKHGGIYIDIDTLPYFDNIYQKTNHLLETLGIRYDENMYLAKTHAFLCKHKYVDDCLIDMISYIKSVSSINEVDVQNIFTMMISDIDNSKMNKAAALGDIYVYDNLISISTVDFIEGVFFNNIIASAPGSWFLNLLFKRILFNYHYIESYNKIFEINHLTPSCQEKYSAFSFLLNYRHDVISKNDAVTFYLAGPMLISNTMYRVICILTGLRAFFSPEKLARLMQSDHFGIGFQKQTLDTPLGLKSSWRNLNE